jgi:uncharacterized membrane protein
MGRVVGRWLGHFKHAARRLRAARHAHHYFSWRERHRVIAAIQHAEHETSGQIRVHVEGHCPGDAAARAQAAFVALGMRGTTRRNGALIYLAVRDRKFAVIGDEGIHAAVPPGFWAEVRDAMAGEFRRGRFCEGVCHGVTAIGGHLKASFPAEAGGRNELPDEISEGED